MCQRVRRVRCALALAAVVHGEPQPEWELAVGRLGHAIAAHPEAFTEKDRYLMDWYYPILGGALRGPAAATRIMQRWDDFVVGGLGIRCVDDRPWVTGAETCELVMALDAIGHRSAGHRQFAAMQHLREDDGSYWTGLVFADGKRWPEERTTWTGAAVILGTNRAVEHRRGRWNLPRRGPADGTADRLRLRMRRQRFGPLTICSPGRPPVRSSTRSDPVTETSRN